MKRDNDDATAWPNYVHCAVQEHLKTPKFVINEYPQRLECPRRGVDVAISGAAHDPFNSARKVRRQFERPGSDNRTRNRARSTLFSKLEQDVGNFLLPIRV